MAHSIHARDTLPETPERKHKTVCIEHGGLAAEIDELILKLWKAEIPTCQSCQDHPSGSGCFWLQFDEQWVLERFLNRVDLFVIE